MLGWYAPVGKGGVWIGASHAEGVAPASWEDRCDVAALAGCRLVVSVDPVCPGAMDGQDEGLPVFARACLARKMDWAHCPVVGCAVPPLAVGLVESWSPALGLGAKIWVQSNDPWTAWPLAAVALAAAGHTPDSMVSQLVEGPSDLVRLRALWRASVLGSGCDGWP